MFKRTMFDAGHEAFRSTVRDFLVAEVVPNYGKWLEEGAPRELFRKLGGARRPWCQLASSFLTC
jgi:acyl-CoA dehydrogenase